MRRRESGFALVPVVVATVLSSILTAIICLTVSTADAGSSPVPQLYGVIDVYEKLLIKITVAGGLTVLCVRIVWSEVSRMME
jgi:hypothetical protein